VKKEGLLKKVRERVGGGDESSDGSGSSGEGRRRGILGRLTGE